MSAKQQLIANEFNKGNLEQAKMLLWLFGNNPDFNNK
jgi:hypothetical protein